MSRNPTSLRVPVCLGRWSFDWFASFGLKPSRFTIATTFTLSPAIWPCQEGSEVPPWDAPGFKPPASLGKHLSKVQYLVGPEPVHDLLDGLDVGNGDPA
jgi:hypothetical protein